MRFHFVYGRPLGRAFLGSMCRHFLLHARYVLNVAKKSIWDQRNIEDRPTTDLRFWKAFLEEIQMAISQQPIIGSTSGLVLVDQFDSAIYIYAQLTLVAMATKFKTKWAITQFL